MEESTIGSLKRHLTEKALRRHRQRALFGQPMLRNHPNRCALRAASALLRADPPAKRKTGEARARRHREDGNFKNSRTRRRRGLAGTRALPDGRLGRGPAWPDCFAPAPCASWKLLPRLGRCRRRWRAGPGSRARRRPGRRPRRGLRRRHT